MPIPKDQGDLTSRGRFPDLTSPPIAHTYGGRPTYASAHTDADKEMGWDLMDIIDGLEDWQEDEISTDNLDRMIRRYRSTNYMGGYEPNPVGFQTAIRSSSKAFETLLLFKDEDTYETQQDSIDAVDQLVAHLSALAVAGLLDPKFYRKGYSPLKKNPHTDNTELLDALFKVITAYRVTYAAVLSDFRTYSARNVQSYFINPASSALQDAARTHKGSFLLSDSAFTDGLIFYLSNITKEPDRTSVVEKNLFNAKSTHAEIIGGGLDSIFW